MADPTYADLVLERQQEWARAQAKAAADLKAQHAAIAKMPDVVNAPSPTEPWGHRGLQCACGVEVFTVARWVTVNGVKHRAELKCLGCGKIGTWDWADSVWIG